MIADSWCASATGALQGTHPVEADVDVGRVRCEEEGNLLEPQRRRVLHKGRAEHMESSARR